VSEVAVGMAAALTSAAGWTLISVLSRTVPQLSAYSLNILRSGLGGLILLALALLVGDLASLGRLDVVDWVCLFLSVILAVGVGDTIFFEAARILGLARAMTITTSYPVMASLLALLIFREPIGPVLALGSLVTLAGLVLIVGHRAPDDPAEVAGTGRGRGLALAFTAAFSWAVGAILIRQTLGEVDALTIQGVRLPLTALVLWATPWARGTVRTLVAHREAILWRVLALGGLSALSSITFILGLKLAGVALGTVLSSTSPLFALPIGWLALGERVSWRAAAGATLATGGVTILSL
jgi:drug/metabolite transporter (DMT)-like permease